MKKTLLTAAIAALAIGSAQAQVYDNYPNMLYEHMSDNGQYIASQNAMSGYTMLNRYTGQQFDFNSEDGSAEYHLFGISNNGIAVGQDGVDACYWENGEKHILPKTADAGTGVGYGWAITPDGKYIAGSLSTPKGFNVEGLMCFPVLWTRNADGTYGDPEVLPYDANDFSHRPAQYIQAYAISDDAKTIIVEVMDYSGNMAYPIIYRRQDDGSWNKKVIGPDVLWDAEAMNNLPAYPEDPSSQIPHEMEYYTKQDSVNYNDAVTAYNDAMQQYRQGLISKDDVPAKPQKWQFITDNREQWVNDSTVYMDKAKQYTKDVNDFLDMFYAGFKGWYLNYNDMYLSHNGKYFITSVMNEAEDVTYPAYIDLTTGNDELTIITDFADAYGLNVANDGTFIVAAPYESNARQSYIGKVGETEGFTPFVDYIAQRDENAFTFLKNNYTFSVSADDDYGYRSAAKAPTAQPTKGRTVRSIVASPIMAKAAATAFDDETEGAETEATDSLVTGTVLLNSDATIFNGLMIEPYSDPEGWQTSRSYLLDLNKGAISSGIKAVSASDADNAPVIARQYYSINGQRLGRLPLKGVYLEKVITTKGVKTIKKVR